MENVDITKVINRNLVTLDLKARTKEEAIGELTDLLVLDDDVTSKKDFVKDVLFRETEGITGLGQGVAIPHGKSLSVKDTSIAIGLSHQPIKWESLDNEPVNLIILFAVRDEDASKLHLKLLQHVAILLADDNFIEKIHNVKSKQEVINLLSKK